MISDKPLTYNPWPIPLDPALQRPELRQLKEAGYEFDDAREVIDLFEKKVAAFAGSKYAVSVDCCTHAVELSIRYILRYERGFQYKTIILPKNTYISIPQTIKNIGLNVEFYNHHWAKHYILNGTQRDEMESGVIDAAVNWNWDMYVKESLYCLSFQIKKPIPIGRGGMILTDDKEAYEWLRLARYDGRNMSLPYDHPEHIKMIGYHYYMTPEDAARGILLMDKVTFRGDSANWTNYPDVSKYFK